MDICLRNTNVHSLRTLQQGSIRTCRYCMYVHSQILYIQYTIMYIYVCMHVLYILVNGCKYVIIIRNTQTVYSEYTHGGIAATPSFTPGPSHIHQSLSLHQCVLLW